MTMGMELISDGIDDKDDSNNDNDEADLSEEDEIDAKLDL